MRILHVIDHWGLGGAQRALSSLITGDGDHTHEVAVLFAHGQVDWNLPESCPLHTLAQSYSGLPLLPPRLRKLLRERQPHVIQVHLNGARPIVAMAIRRTGIPVIWHEHSGVELFHIYGAAAGRLIAAWQRRHIAKLTRVIANSHDTADWCRTVLRVPEHKLHVLYCPVDHDQIRGAARVPLEHVPPGAHTDGPVIGFVGRLAPQKGPLDFIAAVKPLLKADPSARAWMVGDGPLRAEVEARVHAAGLTDQVVFWGYRHDVYAVMNRMNLLLLPSQYEPWGLVVVEALLLGVPVIAYAVGGPAEILTRAGQETLVPRDDVGAMTAMAKDVLARGERVTPGGAFSGIQDRWSRYYADLARSLEDAP